MVTQEEADTALREADDADRAFRARLEEFGRKYGLSAGVTRIVAEFDEEGLLSALTAAEDGPAALESVEAGIWGALVGHIPPGAVAEPRIVDAYLDGLFRKGGVRVSSSLETVTVTALLGVITDVKVSRRLLGGGRPQLICDEVLPIARRAALESDTLGVYGGTR